MESYDLFRAAQVDFPTLASLLRKCGTAKDFPEGKRLHAYLIKRGLHRHLLLANTLLQMYLNCGSLPDVVECFSSMHQKNRFSWNFIITAYTRYGQPEQAVCVFQRMSCEGFLPNEFVFASTVSACASKNVMIHGKHLHLQLLESGDQSNVAVLNALVNMYGKCGCLLYSERLFDQMQDRNVVSWTGMISAYLRNGHGKDAFFMYVQMYQEGVLPNQVTSISMLDACAIHECLMEGIRIHANIIGSGLESEIVLATGLVNMYAKCGRLENASELFISLTEQNTILWTAMIQGCLQQDHSGRALELYRRMFLEALLPDSVTYSSIFDSCASQGALTTGKLVHANIVASGSQFNIITSTSLLNMYGRCGAIEQAHCIFNAMEAHNTLSWTSIISLYAQLGDNEEAIHLFIEMQKEGVPPDKVTFWSVVDACADQVAFDQGRLVHWLIADHRLESDPNLATALVNMYGKCGHLQEAQDLFDSLTEKNLVSWTAMITEYAQFGCKEEALLLFYQMLQEGVTPNRVTYVCILGACSSEAFLAHGKRLHICITDTELKHDIVVMTALINMYSKCTCLEDAKRVFDEMEERNVISWNTMLAAYSNCGCAGKALDLFEEMQLQLLVPSKATFLCVLDACASDATLCKGTLMHVIAVKSGFDLHVDVGNAIISMYGKSGRIKDAHKIFDKMQERDAISWNTMIGLLAQHGQSKGALNLFERMLARGLLPDKVTYIAILSACGRAGLVGEGLLHFNSLMSNSGITPTAEHCHSMIHMFARSGLMEDGERFAEKVPLQPTSVTWMSLLSACRGHTDMSRGEHAVQHAIELDEEKACSYVMLSNIYAEYKSQEELSVDWSCDNEIVYQAVGT